MTRMKISILIIFALFQSAFAQLPYTEFKVGYFNPNDAHDGFLLGIHLGRMIDESISWGMEVDYFQKTYTDETRVSEQVGQTTPDQVTRNLNFVTRMLPVFAKLNFERALNQSSPVYLRASGGVGWQFVWNKVENFESDPQVSGTRFYNGFGWQLTAGAGYEISSKTVFFVDAFYNYSKVKRNNTTNEQGLPTWEELDVSGFGAKIGVSIIGFGW